MADTKESFKNRVKGIKNMKPSDLVDNEKNWRQHPHAQRMALRDVLADIGIAGVVIAYRSERNGGKMTIIDGHMRHEEIDQPIPVVELDLTDAEADKLLLLFDPIAGLAEMNGEKLLSLLDEVRSSGLGDADLMADLQRQAMGALDEDKDADSESAPEVNPCPEMEIQPFEHYDYIMLTFSDHYAFLQAANLFGVEKRTYTLKDGKTKKIGLCRVIDGRKALEIIEGKK